MLIIDANNQPVGRLAPYRLMEVERRRMTTLVRLIGRLVAYVPHNQRAYYSWLVVVGYRPAQYLSVHQYSPSHLKVLLFGRYELGVVLKDWLLGWRLGQPLVWARRTETLAVRSPQ